MPTLEDWLEMDLDDQDQAFVRRLSQLRPQWLGTGDVASEIIVCLKSDIEGAWPIVLKLDALTLTWAEWDDHLYLLKYSLVPIDPAIAAVGLIEGILSGWWVLAVARDEAGEWRGSCLERAESIRSYVEGKEAEGLNVSVIRWPGITIYPPQ